MAGALGLALRLAAVGTCWASGDIAHVRGLLSSAPNIKPPSEAIDAYSLPGFSISAKFDGGSLDVVKASTLSDIRINLKPDPFTKLENTSFYARWYFRVTGVKHKQVKVTILNVNASYVYIPDIPYGGAWQKLYKAKATYDKVNWFQVPTRYDAAPGHLVFEYTPAFDSIFFAYYPHYTVERMDLNVARWQQDPRVKLREIGKSLDGRDINLLQIGSISASKRNIWVQSGQHPGEDQHSAFTEGFVNRVLDRTDSFAVQLLAGAVIWVVPQANPDGIFRGHHRTNAIGYNLNRMWNQSSLTTSPEVLAVQKAMYTPGWNPDFFLDIHGDELENYNIMLYPTPQLPSALTNRTIMKFDQFLIESSGLNYIGMYTSYDSNEYGVPSVLNPIDLRTADAWTANAFDCLGATVELPFTDLIDQVNWTTGWSLERSMVWGSQFVPALARTLPYIRGTGPLYVPQYNTTFFPQDPAFNRQAQLKDPLAL